MSRVPIDKEEEDWLVDLAGVGNQKGTQLASNFGTFFLPSAHGSLQFPQNKKGARPRRQLLPIVIRRTSLKNLPPERFASLILRALAAALLCSVRSAP